MVTKRTLKKRVINHLGRVSLALISVALMSEPVTAVEPLEAIISNESGQVAAKEALSAALKMARSKPAMTTATGIVCLACVPVAGVAASPGLCVAVAILIAKTFG